MTKTEHVARKAAEASLAASALVSLPIALVLIFSGLALAALCLWGLALTLLNGVF